MPFKQSFILAFVVLSLTACQDGSDPLSPEKTTKPVLPAIISVTVTAVGDGHLSAHSVELPHDGSYSFSIVKNSPNTEIVSITGCAGKIVDDHFIINHVISACDIDAKFINVTSFQGATSEVISMPAEFETLPYEDVSIRNLVTSELNYKFKFNDISFYKVNGQYVIRNSTPTPIDKLIVSYGDDKNTVLRFATPLPQYTSANIDLPDEINNSEAIYVESQANLFMPNMTIGAASDDTRLYPCTDANVKCVKPPIGNERVMLQTMASNMHYLYNTKSFLNAYRTMMSRDCKDRKEFSDCANYQGSLDYADLSFLQFGYEDHALSWALFSQVYNAEGWGSGGRPNINNYFDTTAGHIELKDLYVNEKSSQYDSHAYSAGLYKTAFHETGHAYGFSHTSGMSYGLGDMAGQFILDNYSEVWRKTRPAFLTPNIFLKSTFADDMSVKLKLYSVDGIVPGDIKFEVMSQAPLSYKLKYNEHSANTEVVFQFENTWPQPDVISGNGFSNANMGTVIFIRAYSEQDPTDTIATIKFDKSFLQPRVQRQSFSLGGDRLFVIANKSEFKVTDDGWAPRRTCYNMYGTFVQEPDYRLLWERLKASDDLDTLPSRHYLSLTEPAAYKQWKVNFGDNDFTETKHDLRDPIGNDTSFMCVIPARLQ